MKTIIAGSRHINSAWTVVNAVRDSGFRISQVVSGCAKGVDALGEAWAFAYEVPVTHFRPDWRRHGKKAGPIRNQEMVDYADALIAVWDGESRGTADVIRRAERKGLKIYIHRI